MSQGEIVFLVNLNALNQRIIDLKDNVLSHTSSLILDHIDFFSCMKHFQDELIAKMKELENE